MMALVVAISPFVTTSQPAMTSRAMIRLVMMAKPALVGKIAGEQSDNQYWLIKSPLVVHQLLGPAYCKWQQWPHRLK
jgi:hypothetical protein